MRTAVAAAGDEAFDLEQRIGGGYRRLLRLQILTPASNTVKDQASLSLVKHQEIHTHQPVFARGRLRGWYLGRREEHGRAERLGSLLQVDAEHLRPRHKRQQREELLTRRDTLRTQPTKPTYVETKMITPSSPFIDRGGQGVHTSRRSR